MANDLLMIDVIAQNIKKVIKQHNDKYFIKLYDSVISLVRGQYGFNVLPTEFNTREFTDLSSLPDIKLEMFCYYTMEPEQERDSQWVVFLTSLNEIRTSLLTHINIPSPLATVKIDVNFHDDLLDMKAGNRALNCVMSFTYQKYATNT